MRAFIGDLPDPVFEYAHRDSVCVRAFIGDLPDPVFKYAHRDSVCVRAFIGICLAQSLKMLIGVSVRVL